MGWQQHTEHSGTENGLATSNNLQNQPSRLYMITRQNADTGIPRFTLLMWGHMKKIAERENRRNRGYLLCSSTKGKENKIEL